MQVDVEHGLAGIILRVNQDLVAGRERMPDGVRAGEDIHDSAVVDGIEVIDRGAGKLPSAADQQFLCSVVVQIDKGVADVSLVRLAHIQGREEQVAEFSGFAAPNSGDGGAECRQHGVIAMIV